MQSRPRSVQTSRPFYNPSRPYPKRFPNYTSQTLAHTMTDTCVDLESSSAYSSAEGGETPRERIILRPQEYIGSIDKRTQKMWVCEVDSLAQRTVTYVPGLYKIFDEVLIYAADNKQRDPMMDSLCVDVDVHQGRISIYYNGKGVPIELHPEEGLYVPEKIFGHLSNYEDISACGRNGSNCVKLANLFSTEFVIETVDSRLERKYKQIFSENMGKKSEPQITVCLKGVDWTRITFKPDLAKFHMTHLDDDVIALMRKRVLDVAGLLGITVQVVFNGRRFQHIQNFGYYALSYICSASKDRESRLPWLRQRVNDNLEVCVTRSQGTFEQVSFVNKFATTEGGTHVDFVLNHIAQCVAKLGNKLCQTHVEACEVKKHLWIFVNMVMENPTFNSPIRDALTSPPKSFGSSCDLSDEFVENVLQCIIGKLSSPVSSKDMKASKRRG